MTGAMRVRRSLLTLTSAAALAAIVSFPTSVAGAGPPTIDVQQQQRSMVRSPGACLPLPYATTLFRSGLSGGGSAGRWLAG